MPDRPRCRYSMGGTLTPSTYARTVPPDEADLSPTPVVAEGPTSIRVSKGLVLAAGEIGWRSPPSGGPGGQHANRTLSRVEVQFDIAQSPSLGPRQRARLLERFG